MLVQVQVFTQINSKTKILGPKVHACQGFLR